MLEDVLHSLWQGIKIRGRQSGTQTLYTYHFFKAFPYIAIMTSSIGEASGTHTSHLANFKGDITMTKH